MNRAKRLIAVFRSPPIVSAAVHAFTGGGFIVATLLMARLLDPAQFGIATLLIALSNLGAQASPAGFNGVVVRHGLRADLRLLVSGFCVALLSATALALVGLRLYEIDTLSAWLVFFSIVLSGTTLLGVSSLQREHMFMRSVLLSQSANFALMIASVAMVFGIGRNHWFAIAVSTGWYAFVVVLVWARLLRRRSPGPPLALAHLHDVVQFAGVALGIQLMIQLERLLIPIILDIGDLAQFAVVAAIALSPYRLLEMGTVSTLTARLRHLETFAERRRLVVREARGMIALSVIGGFFILAFGKFVSEMFAPGTPIGNDLIGAAVASGIVRVVGAQGRAIASAFASPSDLQVLNASGWATVALGAVCSYILLRLGVLGVICGVTIGWLVRGVISFAITRKYMWGRP